MKKILISLMSFSLLTPSVFSVVSCSNPSVTRPDDNTSQTFQEKMVLLQKITPKLLSDYNIKINMNYSDALSEQFLDLISKNNSFNKTSKIYQLIKANINIMLASNKFLFDVSKIPGYSWISEQAKKQAGQFNIFQTTKYSLYDIYQYLIYPWKTNSDQWSLSVTFFGKDKKLWKGDINSHISYVRINVNKQVLCKSKDGSIDITKTYNKAIHYKEDGELYKIYEREENNNFEYQGWTSGTNLLNVSNLYDDSLINSLDSEIFYYSPTLMDIVNSNPISFAYDLNQLIEHNEQYRNQSIIVDIRQKVTSYLEKNHIYLGDDTKSSGVTSRINNVVFIELFKNALNRVNDPVWSKNEKVQKSVAAFSLTMWNDVKNFVSYVQTKIIPSLNNSDQKTKAWNYCNNINEAMLKDETAFEQGGVASFSESECQNLENSLSFLSTLRPVGNEYYQISQDGINSTNLTTSIIFYKNNDFKNAIVMNDSNLTQFGTNNDYKLGIVIYGPYDMNDSSMAKKIFDQSDFPDQFTAPSKTYLADSAFLNISVEKRLNGFFKKLLEYINKKDGIVVPNDFLGTTRLLNFDKLKDIWKLNKYNSSNGILLVPTCSDSDLGEDWFFNGDSGFSQSLGIKNRSELTLQTLANKFDEKYINVLKNYFIMDSKTNKIGIWNIENKYGWSSDRDINSISGTPSIVDGSDLSKYDDDIAFSDYLSKNGKKAIELTDFFEVPSKDANSSFASSDLREHLFSVGYNDYWYKESHFQRLKVAYASTNSFGEITKSISPNWIYDKNKMDQAIQFTGSNEFEDKVSVDNYYYWNKLNSYYWAYVLLNPEKAGKGYNPIYNKKNSF